MMCSTKTEAIRLLLLGAAVLLSAAGGNAQVAGKPLAEQLEVCAACHGKDGNSEQPDIPSLAGQPELFLVNQMIMFREGLRPSELMAPFAKDLKDDEIIAIAAHTAKSTVRPNPNPAAPEIAARGADVSKANRCGVCHLPAYQGREQIPRIAGQREDYLVKSMKAYRDSQRPGADTNMAAAVYGMADSDIAALAHYLSRKP